MAEPDAKIELAAQLDRARAAMGRNMEALRHDLDVGTHFKQSFHENKTAYIGGAALLGLVLSKLPSRKKKVFIEKKSKGVVKEAEKAGLWLVLLQFAFKALQPMLTKLVTKQVADFVRHRAGGREEA